MYTEITMQEIRYIIVAMLLENSRKTFIYAANGEIRVMPKYNKGSSLSLHCDVSRSPPRSRLRLGC